MIKKIKRQKETKNTNEEKIQEKRNGEWDSIGKTSCGEKRILEEKI